MPANDLPNKYEDNKAPSPEKVSLLDAADMWRSTMESQTNSRLRELHLEATRKGPYTFSFGKFHLVMQPDNTPQPLFYCLLPNEPMVEVIRTIPGNEKATVGTCIGNHFDDLLLKHYDADARHAFYQDLFGVDFGLVNEPGWHETQLALTTLGTEGIPVQKYYEFTVYIPEPKRSQHYGHDVEIYMKDVTEQETAKQTLMENLHHDPLTGLYNRQYIELMLEKEYEVSKEHPVSVLYFDMEGFKEINDNLGHAAGDCQLIIAAELLTRVLRGSDDPELKGILRKGLMDKITDERVPLYQRALQLLREMMPETVLPKTNDGPVDRRRQSSHKNFLGRMGGDENIYINEDIKSYQEMVQVMERVKYWIGQYNKALEDHNIALPPIRITFAGAVFDGEEIITVEECVEPGKAVSCKELIQGNYLVGKVDLNGEAASLKRTVSSADKIMLALKKERKALRARQNLIDNKSTTDYEI